MHIFILCFRKEDYFPPPPPPPAAKDEPLYYIGRDFQPILGLSMPLMQQLCHTVVQERLPTDVLDRQRELKPEEQELLHQWVLNCH